MPLEENHVYYKALYTFIYIEAKHEQYLDIYTSNSTAAFA